MRIYQHSLCQDIVLNLNIVSTYVTIPNALCHVTIFIAIYVKRCLIPNIYILLYFSIKFCDLYMPLMQQLIMNLHVIYISSSQTLIFMLSVKNIFHTCCQNTMFYNYSTKKLILLLKAKFRSYFSWIIFSCSSISTQQSM